MTVVSFEGRTPFLARGAYVASSAMVIGDVRLGEDASVWFGAVLRGDTLAIAIGARTNVQDNAVLHVTSHTPIAPGVGCILGDEVTVGHSAVVHGCVVGDRTLIGIGAIVLDGAHVGSDVIVAAGALVSPGATIPDGTMVMGRPARVVRTLTEEDRARSRHAADAYVDYARRFRAEGL